MDERLIDIVSMSDGTIAGRAELRPITPAPGVFELTLFVEPECRRRGVGSRLLTAVLDRTTASRLVTEVEAGSPGEAFCLRHGFRHTGAGRHDLLLLGDLHRAWLGELIDAEPGEYRLTHWTGELPEPRSVLTTAYADGGLAAYALAIVGVLTEHRARQFGPAVLPGHRGRRLELRVNAALIQHLRESHPHIDEVETVITGDDPVLAAREHLGFRLLRRTHRYELDPGGSS
ncbi:N-acetyltransferase [Actinoplanes lobatus]|uniref:N-acetyltransferase n=1 Tax=Actinoplanes lobatus TaxID=113568 RepID=A0A7W7MIS7_9ACTN|nr:GNAT family N-acetyltransferase [Actinoplanes lobatus]MBB4751305.1 GNAT superfamily N-acetyltransferase [Actinoplanes lobatus]GGN63395.1 N-acetyltransferase [Actinoplanes lobatus]GIE44753.1 N-acetyltransferase [Actinoplanes lobatus]